LARAPRRAVAQADAPKIVSCDRWSCSHYARRVYYLVMTEGVVNPETGPRYGITVPFAGVGLDDHRRIYEDLVRLGYTDAWSAETDGTDGFTPLALAAAWTSSLQLGVAIIPAYTRGPALLATSVAAMAEAARGKFTLGLGTSSDVIVSRWNGMEFTEPYKRVRDTIRFLRSALEGEKIDRDYDTFSVHGFRLSRPVEEPPPIFLAALRPGMLRLAGREADGVILNWLSAEDVAVVKPELQADKPVCARIFVCPSEDTELVRSIARRMIAAYLNVEVYAEFHRWLGRGSALQAMWDAWGSGDRKGALEVIPDEVVDALLVHGSFDECRDHVGRYVANGVDIPVMAVIPVGMTLDEAIAGLAPPWGVG
jgi:probable F420-dependent oxidoreductase